MARDRTRAAVPHADDKATLMVIQLCLLGLTAVALAGLLLLKLRPALVSKISPVIFEASRPLDEGATLPSVSALESQEVGPWRFRLTKISDDNRADDGPGRYAARGG